MAQNEVLLDFLEIISSVSSVFMYETRGSSLIKSGNGFSHNKFELNWGDFFKVASILL